MKSPKPRHHSWPRRRPSHYLPDTRTGGFEVWPGQTFEDGPQFGALEPRTNGWLPRRMRIGANPALAGVRRRLLVTSTVTVVLLFVLSFLLFFPIVSLPSAQVPSTQDILHSQKVDLAGCGWWCPLIGRGTVRMTGSVAYWLFGVGGVTVGGRYMLEPMRLPLPCCVPANETETTSRTN